MTSIQKSKKSVVEPSREAEEPEVAPAEAQAEAQAESEAKATTYDELLDEIDEMLADEEQAQRYAQLSGE